MINRNSKLQHSSIRMNKKLIAWLSGAAAFATTLSVGLIIVGQYYGIPDLKKNVDDIKDEQVKQGKAIARIEGSLIRNKEINSYENEAYVRSGVSNYFNGVR